MENQHLFILSPPASGSTLLWQLLKTSPNVSAFPVEGKGLIKSILFTEDRWNPRKTISWDLVKDKWNQVWDLNKPILLEKSPPHLLRADQIESHFPKSYFIIVMRNPYAFCEGMKRRWDSGGLYFNIAKFWVKCAKFQIQNINKLKNCLLLTYEELTEKPEQTCRKIVDFMPNLCKLNPNETFRVFEKNHKITNLNTRQINHLSNDDIFEINIILNYFPQLLSYFSYQCQEPKAKIRFKTFKRLYLGTASRFQKVGPFRWENWKKPLSPAFVQSFSDHQ